MKQPILPWLLPRVRPRMGALALLTLAQVVHALFSVFFALGSRAVIDSAVAGDPAGFQAACLQQGAIIAVILLSLTLARHLRDRLAADLERDWKRRLLRGLLRGDYGAVSAYHSAELLNRLNNDVEKLDTGILSILPNAAAMVTRLAAAVLVLGALDGAFTLFIALVGVAVIAATAYLRRRLKELNKAVSHHDGKVSGYLQEIMEKLLMVQAMDVAPEIERRAEALLEGRYAVQKRRKNVSLFANTSISLLGYGVSFLALVWCSRRLLQGRMSFGSLTAVIQLVNQIQAPITNLSGLLPQYVAAAAAGERLMELDAIQGQPSPALEDPEALYHGLLEIRAEAVTFSYGRDTVLDRASFRIPKGAFAVITGPSGMGKSTILKLLLGIFQGEEGRIVAQTTAGALPLDRSTRRLFAYVPQGNLLFSGTIRENLTIAAPEASQEDLDRAIYVSCMEEFLPQLPQGLDTLLGESGAGLSEGQAQRLAIGRAVLGGAPILLLDECTSALDEQTEGLVLQRLKALPGRTCIAVTHRPAAMALCTHHLEVEQGQVRWSKERI